VVHNNLNDGPEPSKPPASLDLIPVQPNARAPILP
jgi:hypothetical protein